MVSAPKRLIAVAATGEPESTKYAPSQPAPRVETPFANGNWPSICGPTAAAPSFISCTARMNRKIAGRNSRSFVAMAASSARPPERPEVQDVPSLPLLERDAELAVDLDQVHELLFGTLAHALRHAAALPGS